MNSDVHLAAWITQTQAQVEEALEQALPSSSKLPVKLHTAMRYAVLPGGKRMRPLLAFAAGMLTNADAQQLAPVAAAVELIHAYSLVHDDLPCMDNDVLRRGKPTVHIAYDEATALLVGDALQSLAFATICQPGLLDDAARQLTMAKLLACASGSNGMAGGQAVDLISEGLLLKRAELEQMHRAKTGALLRASVFLGALCGRTLSAVEQKALDNYSHAVGLAFQVVDDILDVEADTQTLGKTSGKDARQLKSTYVSVLGLVESKTLAEELRREAHQALEMFGAQAARLRELADYIVLRTH